MKLQKIQRKESITNYRQSIERKLYYCLNQQEEVLVYMPYVENILLFEDYHLKSLKLDIFKKTP